MYANALAYYDLNDNLKELASAMARKTPAQPTRILVGVDGSAASLGAVEYARDLVTARGGEIRLVNVQPAPPARDARAKGDRALAPAMAVLDAARVPYRAEVAFGKRAESIPRFAERDRCTLIALGESGRFPLAKFISGSVSQRVIRRAPVPVALVKRTLRATTYSPSGDAPSRGSPWAAA